MRLDRERVLLAVVDLLGVHERNDGDVGTRVLEGAVVPAAAVAEPGAGGVDREGGREHGVGLGERAGTEVRAARLGWPARGAFEEVLSSRELGPAALQRRAEHGEQDALALRHEKLDERQRAGLTGAGGVDGDAGGLRDVGNRDDHLGEVGGGFGLHPGGADRPAGPDRGAERLLDVDGVGSGGHGGVRLGNAAHVTSLT